MPNLSPENTKSLAFGNCGGGLCLQEGNDPYCEAQKAAQNSVYAATAAQQKAACESGKVAEKAACEARAAGMVAACKVAKGAGDGDSYEALLGNSSVRQPLPEDVAARLTGLYHADVIGNISVSPVTLFPTHSRMHRLGLPYGTGFYKNTTK
ncbi:hypothetical protein EN866_34995 [Mesorhizobium sp. M2D.F.Ca.ET.223.01.1.1]|uniref:hypothetical protein n=1 Tax=Mesorhizobium sp. M2D.F.Ca.ET.223.01.1.1 TaxID=2563940 RepID=UPI001091E434|nr:hypothetical protein [Mesorhizobium sp. M2D.F.Ca.ET.223.01.1.1]TGR82298.1 hypothetical protein EN866_34995 [Mesorhizobium sp. M2D.F.Ca.ET.223.01.1.1]TGT75991.1 hypothetical protein EN802_07135 [bacterium M00.F.Ca.ET.159.01.1.1]TGT85052.1 hypothetical protein EN800_13865 [bacterium M00.F.Ca.ET.157.01.1.1]